MTPGDEGLRAAVLRGLAQWDEAADHSDAAALVPVARSGISRLAEGWRLLLSVHQPDEAGRCPVCPSSAWRGRRGRRWPCPVWRMAHDQLIGGLTEATGRRGRRRKPVVAHGDVVRDGSGEVVARVYPAPRTAPG
ncbi:hypothetical protein [Actinokineospora pegani]|uniref:hypothetical protein n=1 Tax=Actinokineospora pegani TaxID=2654637 RepID=UPI001F35AC96|nr:hypothetical protein [Actinokineospora pegani]